MKTKFKDTEIGLIPEEWVVTTLEKASQLLTDGSHFSPKEDPSGKYLIATVKDMEDYAINIHSCKRISEKVFFELSRSNCKPEKGDVLFSKDGTMGLCFVFKQNEPIVILSSIALIRPSKDFDSFFLKYYLSSNKIRDFIIAGFSSGSALPRLTIVNLKKIPVIKPDIPEQRVIASVLSRMDAKIELNRQMNATLEAIAQAIFKHWFVDFEFPNEEGKPYKSSGGEMVFNEELQREIPKGWEVGKLGDILENFDSKRIPLSSREREKRKGKFPYYGATKIMDYVDDYLFDGTYILMAEDGSVTDERGYPVLQYVWGKFWANNHAHIIKGKGISTEFLYVLLLRTKISEYVTGAVQPKLNQTNMNGIKILIPDSLSVKKCDNIIQDMFIKQKSQYEQIQSLQKIRDSLLPKLMSGKIRVPVEVE